MAAKFYADTVNVGETHMSLRVVGPETIVLEVAKMKKGTYEPERLILSVPTLKALGQMIAKFDEFYKDGKNRPIE